MSAVATYRFPGVPPEVYGFVVPRAKMYSAPYNGLGSDLSVGSGAAASFLATIAPFTGPGAPFVAAAGAIATLVSQAATLFQGCGPTCVQTSDAANRAGAIATQIRDTYLTHPVHYAGLQATALAGIDQIFTWLNQVCSNPQMGAAGQRCISERLVRGGSAPWCPTNTGCDWITTIRDPVANDPNVVADPNSLSGVLATFTSSGLALPLLVAAIVFGVVLL